VLNESFDKNVVKRCPIGGILLSVDDVDKGHTYCDLFTARPK